MPTKDKPQVNFTFSQFEDADIELFVYMTKANKRVTFPDLYAMEAEEGESLLLRMKSGEVTDSDLLREWLSEPDHEALRADKLSVRRRMQLIQAVFAHYEKYNGTEGEDGASGS